MKAISLFSATFFIAIILGGCVQRTNDTMEDASSTLKHTPYERPFELNGTTSGTFIPPGPDGLCGEDKLTLTIEGTGNATYLGDVTIVGHHCFEGACIWGPLDFIAANGDILYTRCGEDEEGNTFIFCQGTDANTNEGLGVIIGGTGRFEGATGTLNYTITVVDNNATIKALGTIFY